MKKDTLTIALIEEAYTRLKDVVTLTPLQLNKRLSEKYQATVYLKREDLQIVRSYKLRGAYNRIVRLTDAEKSVALSVRAQEITPRALRSAANI